MNHQAVYGQVKKHLLTQGIKSVSAYVPDDDGSASCAYRGVNGTRCAIGCIIPDELYDPKMEGKRASAILREYVDLAEYLEIEDDDDLFFLEGLQSIHDSECSGDWGVNLERFASRWDLAE